MDIIILIIMVIIIMYLISLCGPKLTSEEQSSPSQLARGDGGGQGTCFISTDKLISRSSAQLFSDKRRKKELGAGGESLGQVNCKTERDFPIATNRLPFRRTHAQAKPRLTLVKACGPCMENQISGWTMVGLLGSGGPCEGPICPLSVTGPLARRRTPPRRCLHFLGFSPPSCLPHSYPLTHS